MAQGVWFQGVISLLFLGFTTQAFAVNDMVIGSRDELKANLERAIIAGQPILAAHEAAINEEAKKLSAGQSAIHYRLDNVEARFTHRRTGFGFEKIDAAEVRARLLEIVREVQPELTKDEALANEVGVIVLEPVMQSAVNDEGRASMNCLPNSPKAELRIRVVRNHWMNEFALESPNTYAKGVEDAWKEFPSQTDSSGVESQGALDKVFGAMGSVCLYILEHGPKEKILP